MNWLSTKQVATVTRLIEQLSGLRDVAMTLNKEEELSLQHETYFLSVFAKDSLSFDLQIKSFSDGNQKDFKKIFEPIYQDVKKYIDFVGELQEYWKKKPIQEALFNEILQMTNRFRLPYYEIPVKEPMLLLDLKGKIEELLCLNDLTSEYITELEISSKVNAIQSGVGPEVIGEFIQAIRSLIRRHRDKRDCDMLALKVEKSNLLAKMEDLSRDLPQKKLGKKDFKPVYNERISRLVHSGVDHQLYKYVNAEKHKKLIEKVSELGKGAPAIYLISRILQKTLKQLKM